VHFGLTDEQLAMRAMARRFAEERIAPRYRQREAEARIEPVLLEEMGSLGLIGIDLPEALGGLDLGGVASGLIIEDIAGGDLNVAYVQLLASLNGSIIAAHARPGVAEEIVPRICEGRALVALDFVGFRRFANQAGDALSFGQQRIIEIARTLIHEPKVVLLDEPAVGLSVNRVAELDALPGFRNVLVHEYVSLDLERVVQATARLQPVRTFLEAVRRYAAKS